MEEEKINLNNQMAPWQQSAAFNNYWTYSFMSRAAFYAMVPAAYYDFYNRWIRQWLYWYDGWVPWFHDQENGIPSTRIATALIDRTAKKVVGGRVMFKNAGKESNSPNALNKALRFISGTWAKKSNFGSVVKNAVKFAAAGGTSLLKLNRDGGGLWPEALRMDSFIPTVGFRGDLLEVKCFIQSFTNVNGNKEKNLQVYYLVERRFFGDYKLASGKTKRGVPLVEYVVHRNSGNITNANYVNGNMGECVEFSSLPRKIRDDIVKSYSAINFNKPTLLPFSDHLGCELIKWTDGVSNVPELPFGESLLSTLIPILMAYDYYFGAFDTDMYTGRARVLAPVGAQSAKTGGSNYNSGLDSFMLTKMPYTNPDDQKPIPLQFDLRSASWTEIRNMLIQNIAVQTGLNISTIASFLQDTTGAKTAREISSEENETVAYVDDKREIIERPINRILKLITLYHGYSDDVVVRWSGAGLTNRYTLAEILSMGLNGGFLSRQKAVQMFNFDDDDEQVDEEYRRIEEDGDSNLMGNGEDFISEENSDEVGGQGTEYVGASNRRSAGGNSSNST